MREGSGMSDAGPDEVAAEVFRRADAFRREECGAFAVGDPGLDGVEVAAEFADGTRAAPGAEPAFRGRRISFPLLARRGRSWEVLSAAAAAILIGAALLPALLRHPPRPTQSGASTEALRDEAPPALVQGATPSPPSAEQPRVGTAKANGGQPSTAEPTGPTREELRDGPAETPVRTYQELSKRWNALLYAGKFEEADRLVRTAACASPELTGDVWYWDTPAALLERWECWPDPARLAHAYAQIETTYTRIRSEDESEPERMLLARLGRLVQGGRPAEAEQVLAAERSRAAAGSPEALQIDRYLAGLQAAPPNAVASLDGPSRRGPAGIADGRHDGDVGPPPGAIDAGPGESMLEADVWDMMESRLERLLASPGVKVVGPVAAASLVRAGAVRSVPASDRPVPWRDPAQTLGLCFALHAQEKAGNLPHPYKSASPERLIRFAALLADLDDNGAYWMFLRMNQLGNPRTLKMRWDYRFTQLVYEVRDSANPGLGERNFVAGAALKRQANDPLFTWNTKVGFAEAMCRFGELLDEAEAAPELRPRVPTVLYDMAMVADYYGEKRSAIEYLRRAREAAADDVELLAYLRRAEAAVGETLDK